MSASPKTQLAILRKLPTLLEKSTLKVLITSRYNARIMVDVQVYSSHLICLAMDDKAHYLVEDVNRVIEYHLQRLVERGACRPAVCESLKHTLKAQADTTFLWIRLVVPLLERCRALLADDVPKVTPSLPLGLDSVYKGLLNAIPGEDRTRAAKILRLIVASDRPLSSAELAILYFISPEVNSAVQLDEQAQAIDQGMIESVLGPLVRLNNGKFRLVHQSLKDYLTDSNITATLGSALAEFQVDLVSEKASLAGSCLRYLLLEEIQHICSTLDDDFPASQGSATDSASSSSSSWRSYTTEDSSVADRNACLEIASKYKLFDYASLHWPGDLHFVGDNLSRELCQLALSLLQASNEHSRSWLRYYWLKKMAWWDFPDPADALTMAAFFGHHQIIPIFLENNSSSGYSLDGAAYWAVRRDQAPCLVLLIRNSGRLDPSLINFNRLFLSAARYRATDCLKVLLEFGKLDVDGQDPIGSTPRALPASKRQSSNVKSLLKNIDVNCTDDYGHNALNSATQNNDFTAVHLLLAHRPSIFINNRDRYGQNSISIAAQHGYFDILKLLHQTAEIRGNGASVDDLLTNPDYNGCTPIWHAARLQDPSCIKYLLVHTPAWAADTRDKYGETPLMVAASYGCVEVVRLLLRSGRVEVDARDDSGRTPLALAAWIGEAETVTVLLESGKAEVDARDNEGRTPLALAAVRGRVGTVTVLLENGKAEVNASNGDGWTPLVYAVHGRSEETVALLLAAEGVERDWKDEHGATLADVARQRCDWEIVKLLERVDLP